MRANILYRSFALVFVGILFAAIIGAFILGGLEYIGGTDFILGILPIFMILFMFMVAMLTYVIYSQYLHAIGWED
jgi:hypothetical protein